MHHWSTKELIKFYEEKLENGNIREGGASYNRMQEFRDKLKKEDKKKRIQRMRKANKLIQSKNGKAK